MDQYVSFSSQQTPLGNRKRRDIDTAALGHPRGTNVQVTPSESPAAPSRCLFLQLLFVAAEVSSSGVMAPLGMAAAI